MWLIRPLSPHLPPFCLSLLKFSNVLINLVKFCIWRARFAIRKDGDGEQGWDFEWVFKSLDGWLLGNIVEFWSHVSLKKSSPCGNLDSEQSVNQDPPTYLPESIAVCSGDKEADLWVGHPSAGLSPARK